MEMNFLDAPTRDAMNQNLALLAQVYPPFQSQPLTTMAGRAEASLGDFKTCLASSPEVAQYVVPHFNNRALTAYLTEVPRGLPGCLIPKRQRQLGQLPGHFYPSGACRQLLLKTVSERCCALQVVYNWQAALGVGPQNHQTMSYANVLAVKQFQSHWNDFQQEVHYHLMSLNVLDADDLVHLHSLVRFLHENGLIAQIDMSLEQIFQLFFCDAASVVPSLSLGPKTCREVCEWANLFFLWITVESGPWPHRQLYTNAMAYLQYAYVRGRCQPPLKGMASQKISPALWRSMRYSRLESMTLLANLEQSQFRAPIHCWLDLRRLHLGLEEVIKDLSTFDAMAYPPPMAITKMAILLHQQEAVLPLLQQHQPEAAFFLKMAEAESASQRSRHFDVLHILAELLANYHYPPNVADPLALHPRQLLPDLYLLLGKTFAAVHASDDTVVACFQQARALIDQDKPFATGEIDTRRTDQLSLAILSVLNTQGLLQQAGLFFQHVMEENGLTLLKQSTAMHELCCEYIQNTVFAWLENGMAYLLGFQQYHQKCLHTEVQLRRSREGNTDGLLHKMCAAVSEVKDLIALNQRFIRSGNLALSVNASPWGAYGTAGQETTLECLSLKAKFYEWLIRFISTRTLGSAHNPSHTDQLTLLVDQYQSWARIVPTQHPLYLEVADITVALSAAWDCVNDPVSAAGRLDHTKDKLDEFVHHLKIVEARSGTRYSLDSGNQAFKIYVWMSVSVAFSGDGKNDAYTVDMLRKANLNYLRATRGLGYRLPICSLLLDHLGACSELAVNVNRPANVQEEGTGKVFPAPATAKPNCQCGKFNPFGTRRVTQSHEENHTPASRWAIMYGFRFLGQFSLKALLSTRQQQQSQLGHCQNSAAGGGGADAHNAFLLNRLLRGPDGPILAKAINYSTYASVRARQEKHPNCAGP
jgi:hypothetical protein